MHDALRTNLVGEPGWSGTGWRALRDLKRQDIGGKDRNDQIALKMLGSLDMVLILWRLHGLVLMIVVAI